ncbi:MAG: CoA transferase [Pusillimonas sp.]
MDNITHQGAALSGIRIIDLTTIVFGPYATQTLADYGADVIKVESPEGDGTRYNGPAPEHGMSSMFLGSNRGKRSVVLDLKSEAGRQALLALCDSADVFVHNMRPQKLERMGLGSEVLRARNPRLIFVALLGFGSDGPYAGTPAYDDIIQALSGTADLMQRATGKAGYMPTVMADKVAAQMAAHAMLAALFQRERTGRGQAVEVPMFEAVTSFVLVEHLYGGHWRPKQDFLPDSAEELGYPRLFAAWRCPYKTADSYACVMPYTNENWRRFFHAINREDLLRDSRFQSIAGRTEHVEELLRIVGSVVVSESTEYWLRLCRKLDIPCSPVNRLEDLETDPHLSAVGFFQSLPLNSGSGEEFRFPRFALRLSDSRVTPSPPPRLGQHSEEVLSSLGLSDAVLAEVLLHSRDHYGFD